jgi:hypothetical protein
MNSRQFMRHKLLIGFALTLLFPSIVFADLLDCKDIPYVFTGKVVGFIGDVYTFETIDKILINYETGTCKVYKNTDEINQAYGWKKSDEK